VAIDEPTYDPTGGRGLLRRYWRGPTWINAAWLLWLGLRRRGQDGQAAELTNRLEAAITREGVREYYDPRTGRGLGAKNFAWSTLILEMTDPGTSASGSYL
jgi:glycogen debranching enzyme